MNAIRKIIRADGTEEMLERTPSARAICRLINAVTLDSFMLADRIHVCMLDDQGYETKISDHRPGVSCIEVEPIRARKPVNEKATALYHAICKPGTTHQIVGDVVIVPDDDFA